MTRWKVSVSIVQVDVMRCICLPGFGLNFRNVLYSALNRRIHQKVGASGYTFVNQFGSEFRHALFVFFAVGAFVQWILLEIDEVHLLRLGAKQ